MGYSVAVRAELVGSEVTVPLVGGGQARYANLDYAASAPALREVWDAVSEFMPWYSSVHRGAGYKSQVSTAAFESARQTVRGFLGARPDDAVIFTRNTTDAINLLARSLPTGSRVVTTAAEHHANLLPWRRHDCTVLPVTGSAGELLRQVRGVLAGRPATLLALTGASNVTGEVWPVADLARIAHDHGARIFVDLAQLAPHRRVDIAELGLDWVALSGHKLYAPFGSGVLAGRSDWLAEAEPYLVGGGAVKEVADEVTWAGLPDRHEGGTPNVVGAVALAAACKALAALGRDDLTHREEELRRRLEAGLATIPGIITYRTWAEHDDRLGIVTFNLDGWNPGHLAAALSAEHGIGVRSGSFCAHPLMAHLSGARPAPGCTATVPGAIRASLGIGTDEEDVDRLVEALRLIAREGTRRTYVRFADGTFKPDGDDRPAISFG